MTLRPRVLRISVFGLSFLLCVQAVSAHAAPSEAAALVIKQSARAATAFFSSVDASGCISTAVFVVAAVDDEQTLPAAPVATPRVALVISQFDSCAIAPMLTGNGVTTDAAIVVAPNLNAATVTATVPVLNGADGNLVNVYVDLHFDATSSMLADNGLEQNWNVPEIRINTAFHQTFRNASAYGSITSFTGQLTPGPSVEAMIQNIIVGTVVIDSE